MESLVKAIVISTTLLFC